MKRFMANFICADAGKPKRQQQPKSDPVSNSGVAFVSPNKKSKELKPGCHVCGKQHSRDWEKCNQISETARGNIGKMVKTSAFDIKSGSGSGNTTTERTF
jgi:hypothetical protein